VQTSHQLAESIAIKFEPRDIYYWDITSSFGMGILKMKILRKEKTGLGYLTQ